MAANSDIKIVEYTPKSIVVIGDTFNYKDELKELKGTFRKNWKCGPGWMFPATKREDVKNILGLTDKNVVSNTDINIKKMQAMLDELIADKDGLELLNKYIESTSLSVKPKISEPAPKSDKEILLENTVKTNAERLLAKLRTHKFKNLILPNEVCVTQTSNYCAYVYGGPNDACREITINTNIQHLYFQVLNYSRGGSGEYLSVCINVCDLYNKVATRTLANVYSKKLGYKNLNGKVDLSYDELITELLSFDNTLTTLNTPDEE